MPDLLRLGLLDRLLMLPERLPRPAQEQIRISHTDMRIISEKFEVQTRAKTSLFCFCNVFKGQFCWLVRSFLP